MTKNKLHLSLRTPFATLLDEAVDSVMLDTDAGQITLLAGHASVTGMITAGKAEIKFGGHDKVYFVRQAIFDVDNATGKLSIMAMEADLTKDIEIKSIKEYLQTLEGELVAGGKLSQLRQRFLQNEKLAIEKTIVEVEKS